jgi:threonine dehydrogenase-like Zn-dependent dehydrogenase
MKALCWQGKKNITVENVKDPSIVQDRDAIIKVTKTAICGSDLHLYNGMIPTMESGDILGHEFMGEVIEVGLGNEKLKRGDRVIVPFTIACGACFFCKNQFFSACDNSNPNAKMLESLYGSSGSGLFGYSHMMGGYPGGQAEYVRVPFSDVGPFVIPPEVEDEQVLFLTDILPTAFMAAENCGLKGGETVAIWGCGPVGLLSISCAYLLGAKRVISIDHVPARLKLASEKAKAETINFDNEDVIEKLRSMTGGRGPDACIDAVGMEAHGSKGSDWLRNGSFTCAARGDSGLSKVRNSFDSWRLRGLA